VRKRTITGRGCTKAHVKMAYGQIASASRSSSGQGGGNGRKKNPGSCPSDYTLRGKSLSLGKVPRRGESRTAREEKYAGKEKVHMLENRKNPKNLERLCQAVRIPRFNLGTGIEREKVILHETGQRRQGKKSRGEANAPIDLKRRFRQSYCERQERNNKHKQNRLHRCVRPRDVGKDAEQNGSAESERTRKATRLPPA